jgi:hypothetical protein
MLGFSGMSGKKGQLSGEKFVGTGTDCITPL